MYWSTPIHYFLLVLKCFQGNWGIKSWNMKKSIHSVLRVLFWKKCYSNFQRENYPKSERQILVVPKCTMWLPNVTSRRKCGAAFRRHQGKCREKTIRGNFSFRAGRDSADKMRSQVEYPSCFPVTMLHNLCGLFFLATKKSVS